MHICFCWKFLNSKKKFINSFSKCIKKCNACFVTQRCSTCQKAVLLKSNYSKVSELGLVVSVWLLIRESGLQNWVAVPVAEELVVVQNSYSTPGSPMVNIQKFHFQQYNIWRCVVSLVKNARVRISHHPQ